MGGVLQLRVWIRDTKPEVWRQLLVDPRLSLEQIHLVLQVAFGWEQAHLHQFSKGRTTLYRAPSPFDRDDAVFHDGRLEIFDERRVLIGEVLRRANATIDYEYDFGDSWMHRIKLERTLERSTLEIPQRVMLVSDAVLARVPQRAAICIDGERSGPPEDCGGVFGLQDLLHLLASQKSGDADLDEDQLERLDWCEGWDPEVVDLVDINANLSRIRVKRANQARPLG